MNKWTQPTHTSQPSGPFLTSRLSLAQNISAWFTSQPMLEWTQPDKETRFLWRFRNGLFGSQLRWYELLNKSSWLLQSGSLLPWSHISKSTGMSMIQKHEDINRHIEQNWITILIWKMKGICRETRKSRMKF